MDYLLHEKARLEKRLAELNKRLESGDYRPRVTAVHVGRHAVVLDLECGHRISVQGEIIPTTGSRFPCPGCSEKSS